MGLSVQCISYYEHKEDERKIIQATSQQNYLW